MQHAIYQQTLDRLLSAAYKEFTFPSAVCAVGIRDAVLAESCIGEVPLPGNSPATPCTLYDMASITKVMSTTMITLQAYESGLLQLNDPVARFFPDAPDDKASITIRQLLTHTGGFPPHFFLEEEANCPDNAAYCILQHPLDSLPGTEMHYSCMGFILLGKILEHIYGETLSTLAHKMVFQPLCMHHTAYGPVRDITAATEIDPATGLPLIGIVHDENARFLNGISANAGVFSDLRDMERFCTMLSRYGEPLITRATMQLALHNHTPGEDQHRGLGFQLAGTSYCFIGEHLPLTAFGHNGFTGTSIMVEPDSGLWVVLLSNHVYPHRGGTKIFPFRRLLHNTLWDTYQQYGLSERR